YRTAKEPHERRWWQILWLLAQGRTATELAGVPGYSAYWIGQLAKRHNEQGPAGMRNRQHTASRRMAPLLIAEQQEELRQVLAGPAPEDDRWSARTVAEHVHLLFLPPYSPELQPAEHLWPLTNTVLINLHFADLEELEDAQARRCVACSAAAT